MSHKYLSDDSRFIPVEPNVKKRKTHYTRTVNSFEATKEDLNVLSLPQGHFRCLLVDHVCLLTIPIFLDEEAGLDEAYGVEALPLLLFVSPEGIVNNVRHSLPQ